MIKTASRVVAVTTAIFFGLRVGGLLDWSWVWVFSPLWFPTLIALLAVLVFIVGVKIIIGKGGSNG